MTWIAAVLLTVAQDSDEVFDHNPKRKCYGNDVISSQREHSRLECFAMFVNDVRFAHVGHNDESDIRRIERLKNVDIRFESLNDSFRNANVTWDLSHNVYIDIALSVFSPQRHFSNVRECDMIRSMSVWNVGSEWNLSRFSCLPGLPHPCGITIKNIII